MEVHSFNPRTENVKADLCDFLLAKQWSLGRRGSNMSQQEQRDARVLL